MSSVKAFTEDIAFEAKIASFYDLNADVQTDLLRSVSALLEQKGKEHNFLVWRVQLKGQKREVES